MLEHLHVHQQPEQVTDGHLHVQQQSGQITPVYRKVQVCQLVHEWSTYMITTHHEEASCIFEFPCKPCKLVS